MYPIRRDVVKTTVFFFDSVLLGYGIPKLVYSAHMLARI
jgi:hypothetical protein